MARRWTRKENRTLRVLRYQLKLSWREVGEIMHRKSTACQAHDWELKNRSKDRSSRPGQFMLRETVKAAGEAGATTPRPLELT
jgi:hypothetical protein